MERADAVLATQGRLRSLLHASRVVVEEIDLPTVLRRIVEAALELVGARYGALGVLAPDGTLEQFIHVGLTTDQAEAIGDLPRGRGLLGAIGASQRPLRLEHIGGDARSSGFPPNHPPMDAFLGVPIRVRDELFGNLYLTRDDGGTFSEEDEELVVSLAAAAGGAIDHARVLEEARRREAWSNALTEVTTALLSTDGVVDGLAVIVDNVLPVVGADFGCIVSRDDAEMLRLTSVRGFGAGDLPSAIEARASRFIDRSLASGDVTSGSLRDDGIWPEGLRWAVAVPFAVSGITLGTLLLAREHDRQRFSAFEMQLAADFAAQASVAIELARGRSDRQELQRIEDRGRIARDLHDHVIQRLFAVGLTLQSIEPAIPERFRRELNDQIDGIDAAIAEIRTAVFTLTRPRTSQATLRHRVLEVVSEAGATLRSTPTVAFAGAVDVLVPEELGDDVVAVVRESLTNVARHADASAVEVRVAIQDGSLHVRVDDDGRGVRGATRASGTANLAARAVARGGDYSLESRPNGGTSMVWRVPLGGDGVAEEVSTPAGAAAAAGATPAGRGAAEGASERLGAEEVSTPAGRAAAEGATPAGRAAAEGASERLGAEERSV